MTFPGFCKICEQKFTFESKKQLVTTTDYLLQLIRSASYELRIAQLEKNQLEKILKNIVNKSSKKAETYLKPNISNLKLRGINEIEAFIQKQIIGLNKRIENKSNLYKKICNEYNTERNGKIINIKMKLYLPVFLMYCGRLQINYKKGDVILNLSPIDKEFSEITIINFNKQFSERFLSKIVQENIFLLIINLLNISSNWIINKDFWENNISDQAQKKILKNKLV